MSYSPKNVSIFTSAYAGALAGMGLSDRIISDTNPTNYAGLASVAGAFAQAFDTAWTNSRITSQFDIEAVQSVCQAAWQDRSPNATLDNTNPVSWAALSLAIIATITASESYFTSQGIPQPTAIGPGGDDTTFQFKNGLVFDGCENLKADISSRQVKHLGKPNHLEEYSRFIDSNDTITTFIAEARSEWARKTSLNAASIDLMNISVPIADWGNDILITVTWVSSLFTTTGLYAYKSTVAIYNRVAGIMSLLSSRDASNPVDSNATPTLTASVVNNDTVKLAASGYAGNWMSSAHIQIVKK